MTTLDARDASLHMRIQDKADLAVSQAQEDLEGAKAVWNESLHAVRRTLATDMAADRASAQGDMADLRTTTATAAQRLNERLSELARLQRSDQLIRGGDDAPLSRSAVEDRLASMRTAEYCPLSGVHPDGAAGYTPWAEPAAG